MLSHAAIQLDLDVPNQREPFDLVNDVLDRGKVLEHK